MQVHVELIYYEYARVWTNLAITNDIEMKLARVDHNSVAAD